MNQNRGPDGAPTQRRQQGRQWGRESGAEPTPGMPSQGYGLCPRERSNEARARDAAMARLWTIPTAELAERIEEAVARGDVMNAIQYARMMDKRARFVSRAVSMQHERSHEHPQDHDSHRGTHGVPRSGNEHSHHDPFEGDLTDAA